MDVQSNAGPQGRDARQRPAVFQLSVHIVESRLEIQIFIELSVETQLYARISTSGLK